MGLLLIFVDGIHTSSQLLYTQSHLMKYDMMICAAIVMLCYYNFQNHIMKIL